MTQVLLPAIRRKALGDQLEARLRAMPGPTVTGYRGEVGPKPSTMPDSDRVAPYWVLFDGSGPTDLEPDLAGQNEDLRWTPQITIAAGFSPDCVQTVDRVCAWIYRWAPVLPDLAAGPLEPPPGYDPGQVRPDRTVSPIRFFLPMQWQLVITA